VIRGTDLSASMWPRLIEEIESAENITLRPRTVVAGARGADRLEGLVLRNLETELEAEAACDALFILIGAAPNSALLRARVACDDRGFVLTGVDLPRVRGRVRGWQMERDPFFLETSVPGVFAAGDVRAGSSKRVSAAVGEGSVAVSLVQQYLAGF
jgi:thioredoxin reductase (NADPH)